MPIDPVRLLRLRPFLVGLGIALVGALAAAC
jgi:hypothetical protein